MASQTRAPVSQKVVAATVSSLTVSIIIFVLTTYVSYFNHEIPTTLTPLIQSVGAAAGALVGGYAAKHQATLTEVQAAFSEAESLLKLKDDLPPQLQALTQTFEAHLPSVTPQLASEIADALKKSAA